MSELLSLSSTSLRRGGRSTTLPSSRGRGGRTHGHYTALDIHDMDEIPLVNHEEDGGGGRVSNDGREEMEEDVDDRDDEEGVEGSSSVMWERVGGRKRWQQRMKSHSTLVSLLCGEGWQVLLAK